MRLINYEQQTKRGELELAKKIGRRREMSNIDYLRREIKKLWKRHKELLYEIESLECQLSIEFEKEEQEKRDWVNSNRDREWW